MLSRVSSPTTSLMKNLEIVLILGLRLPHKHWRSLLINGSSQQAYHQNFLKLTSCNFFTRKFLTITIPFILNISRKMLCALENILVVLFITIRFVFWSSPCAYTNHLLILVIYYFHWIEKVGLLAVLRYDNHNNFNEVIFKRLLRTFGIWFSYTYPHSSL